MILEQYPKELIEGPTEDKQQYYSIWIYVKDHYYPESNNGMKHVFTHGPDDNNMLQSPGLWLSGGKNDLQFIVPVIPSASSCTDSEEQYQYSNSFTETIDVENIPIVHGFR